MQNINSQIRDSSFLRFARSRTPTENVSAAASDEDTSVTAIAGVKPITIS